MVYNLNSTCRAVEIENGFNLYRGIYDRPGHPCDDWSVVFASKSDAQAIDTAFKLEPKEKKCIYVNRLILREDGEPSSIIIWGN